MGYDYVKLFGLANKPKASEEEVAALKELGHGKPDEVFYITHQGKNKGATTYMGSKGTQVGYGGSIFTALKNKRIGEAIAKKK